MSKNRNSTHIRIDCGLYSQIKQRAKLAGLPIKTFVEACLLEQMEISNNKFLVERVSSTEQNLRKVLSTLDKNSIEFNNIYQKWFTIRGLGTQLGCFNSFVPSTEEK